MTRRLVVFGTAVMTTLLGLVLLWQFRVVVMYVLISLMLATAARPLLKRLTGKVFLVKVAWILIYLVALGSFSFLLFRTGEIAVYEIELLANNVSEQDEWTLPVWLAGSSFQSVLVSRLPPPSGFFEAITGSEGQLVLPALLGFSRGIGSVVSAGIVILFLSIYWSINQIHFERLWLSLLPSDQRKSARGVWRVVELDIGSYLRSQLIHSLLTGLLLGLGYWLLRSPYPVFLALAGAVAILVPMVGLVLALIPVLLVGLMTSIELSLFTVLFTLIVLISLRIWLKPKLFKQEWENSILTIVLLLALADVFGFIGIIIAPLISIVLQILWSRLVTRRSAAGAAAQISDLKERQEKLLETIQTMDELSTPLITSSMQRLSTLIEKAEPVLNADLLVESSETMVSPKQE